MVLGKPLYGLTNQQTKTTESMISVIHLVASVGGCSEDIVSLIYCVREALISIDNVSSSLSAG